VPTILGASAMLTIPSRTLPKPRLCVGQRVSWDLARYAHPVLCDAWHPGPGWRKALVGAPRVVPGVTGPVPTCVTQTFESAAEDAWATIAGDDTWASNSMIAAMEIMGSTSLSSALRRPATGADHV
jgi:hypothetical protein